MPIMEEDKKSYVFAGKGGYLNLKKKKKKGKKREGKKKKTLDEIGGDLEA